ncbi:MULTISPECIES: ABC transporter permease [unclassified Brenneria]|uniref:ABC transporter permease n=1 Tax=unclassified Brenneria TaxID=2634434 RepID=UPI0029C228D0|nr:MULTISPECIES: ABC transporter permease [unclassified Brenneria]MDX5627626.1 ABC transporter permease [Brenneria sp. L3-3Z]MDX5695283.1 ABC transporter permease [Brenneria sp. L4-2C]
MNKVIVLKMFPLTWPTLPKAAFYPLVVPLGLLLLWFISSRHGWMPPQILPSPAMVARTAAELWQGDLLSQLLVSLRHLFAGLLAGVLAGTLLGALMGASPRAAGLLHPTVYALAQIPTLGWIPLFMVLFGIDDGLKLAVIVKAVIVPVTLHTQSGVSNIPHALLEVARTLRLPWRQRLIRLTLPAMLPVWLVGLRLALSQAWVSLIVVELLASSQGIGYLLVWGRQLFQLDIVFVCIAVIGLAGLAMEWTINRLEQRLVYWPHPPVSRLNAQPSRWLNGLLLPVALLALWRHASLAGWVDAALLPPPSDVLHTLIQGLRDGVLLDAMRHSLMRALAGAAVGVSAGLLLGIVLGLSPRADAMITPTVATLRQIALFAWLPLLTAWVGNGEAGKVAFVALAAFFPMLVASHRGIRQRSLQLQEVAQVLQLSLALRLRVLILPGAAPAIFAGLRLSLIYAWLGTIGAEYFMASNIGIGSLMINAQQLLDMPTIISGMLLIGITGAAIDRAGLSLEKRMTRWRTAGESA